MDITSEANKATEKINAMIGDVACNGAVCGAVQDAVLPIIDRAITEAAKPLVEALQFYADRAKWCEGIAAGEIAGAKDGEPFMAFSDGEDHPWSVAEKAVEDWKKDHP